MLDVVILNPKRLVQKGKADSVKLPGESGIMEICPFHKNILSRLLSGSIVIDDKTIVIKRGLVKVKDNKVTIIYE